MVSNFNPIVFASERIMQLQFTLARTVSFPPSLPATGPQPVARFSLAPERSPTW